MKHQCLFVAVILLFALQSAKAQISIAPTMGVNLSKSAFTNDIFPGKEKMLSRYFIGLQADYAFKSKFSIQLSGQYSEKGMKTNDVIGISAFRFNYLDFLTSVEYRPVRYLGFFIGTNLGIKLSENVMVNNEWTSKPTNFSAPYDIGALAGLKFYISKFYVSILYNQAFYAPKQTDFFLSDVEGNQIGYLKTRNKNLQLGIGYKIDL